MGENEIIGHIHLRLRQNSVSDVEIMKLLEKKHMHGCKTNTSLIKKALLFYITAKREESTGIKDELVRDVAYDSLFK